MLEGFPQTDVLIDGERILVALADTADSRRRGLMGVSDLGEVEGMLFTWGGETVTSGFTMRGTLIELDIGFFAADGELVDHLRMVPCGEEPCPVYRAGRPYAYAVEFPAGTVALGPGSLLVVAP